MNFCRFYNKIIKKIGLNEFKPQSEINVFIGCFNLFMASTLYTIAVVYTLLYLCHKYVNDKTTSRCDLK